MSGWRWALIRWLAGDATVILVRPGEKGLVIEAGDDGLIANVKIDGGGA